MQPAHENPPDSIGVMIRQMRLAKGLTLEELARRVGCVKGYLSAIERGKRPLPQAGIAARLEAELSAPLGVIVRAAAWCRTPGSVREEIRAARGEKGLGCGQEGRREAPRLSSISGLEGADRVVVVMEDVRDPSLRAGDLAVLGAVVGTENLREGCLVAVERDRRTSIVRWPECGGAWGWELGSGGAAVAVRPVLGMCRVFSGV